MSFHNCHTVGILQSNAITVRFLSNCLITNIGAFIQMIRVTLVLSEQFMFYS